MSFPSGNFPPHFHCPPTQTKEEAGAGCLPSSIHKLAPQGPSGDGGEPGRGGGGCAGAPRLPTRLCPVMTENEGGRLLSAGLC